LRGCLVMPGWSQRTCWSSVICRHRVQWILPYFYVDGGEQSCFAEANYGLWWAPYKNISFDNFPSSFGNSPEKLQPTRILQKKCEVEWVQEFWRKWANWIDPSLTTHKFWRLLKDPMVAGRGPPKSLL
jgi:hypothetical protein